MLSSILVNLYTEIKARKVRQRVAIYLSAALTILGVINLFTGVYKLPPIIFDIALVILLCGFPCALIASWIHGKEGAHRVRWGEYASYGFFVILAVVLVVRLVGSPRIVSPGEEKSVAVLPFVNMSDNKDDEYFSDGVTEDIITRLSKVAELTVISRTSTMRYKNTTKSISDIARDLNVTHILEGSIRRSNGRVRIVSQLIDARADKHIWAETYDRDINDVFAIQSEVAQSIARELQTALSPEEVRRIEKHGTGNLEAYGFYLRGREYYYRYSKEDNESAIEFFRKALSVDSSYALAYAGLGDAFGMRRSRYGLEPAWADSAIAASNAAIALDPGMAEGYKALGLALDIKGRTREALQQYYKAVELNPNYAPVVANIGSANYSLGHFDEALPWVKKAVALQPSSQLYYSLVGLQYFSLGFDSAASFWLSRSLALQPESVFPKILLSYIDLYGGNSHAARERMDSVLRARPEERGALEAAGDIAILSGDFDRARMLLERASEQVGVESPAGVKLSYVLTRLGRMAEAERNIADILALYDVQGKTYPEGSQIPYVVAEAYALRNDSARAGQWLQTAIAGGYSDYRWASVDPLLEKVRGTESCSKAMAVLRLRFEAMRARVESH